MTDIAHVAVPAERTLLIVEDDKSFLQRLARAMEARGFGAAACRTIARPQRMRPADWWLLAGALLLALLAVTIGLAG